MKTTELNKILKKGGCVLLEHGKKHDLWFSPSTGKKFLVWRHPSKEVPKGTCGRILKDAGLK